MSRTEVFIVQQDGEVESYAEIRNSWRYGHLIWDRMAHLYNLFDSSSTYQNYLMDKKAQEALWEGFSTGKFTRQQNLLVGSTSDRVWVRRSGLPELIEACRSAAQWWGGSLAVMADAIEKAMAEHPTMIGVAFNMTSVSHPFWCGQRGGEDSDYVGFNVLKNEPWPDGNEYPGKTAWELMEELDRPDRGKSEVAA